MEINWADRYLPILDALVLHTNCVMRTQHIRLDRGDGIMLSQHEWQAFSYLVQHEAENINMVTLSTELAIPKSSLTKISKMLCAHDMVKKYHLEDNKKEIFLKPTEKDAICILHIHGSVHANFLNRCLTAWKVFPTKICLFLQIR